ncbi:hypothetical protein [Corynebacterium glyciniphilum]|uniref:hypothetical protein n=1 Tax=Corynebacterium glyciniphilum TaxID=1404244 RepID=UPI003FCFBC0E
MSTAQTLLGVLEVILLFGGIPMGVSALVLVFMHLSERDNADELRTDSRSLGNLGAAVCGIAVGVSLWLLWFSWGDPAGYASWAIVGAVVTALTAVIGIGTVTRWRQTGPFVVSLGGLFGFSSAFAVDASFYDITGLWGVGYLMIIFIAGFILAAIATGVVLARGRGTRGYRDTGGSGSVGS